MCGIVGYIGKDEIKIKQLIKNAQFNSHRGDDGVGLVYKHEDNIRVRKLLYELNEISDAELEDWRTLKKERKGSFEYLAFDKSTYNKENSKFRGKMLKILDTTSPFIFVHHRKSTYGSDSIENLHPMKINGKYYIHNGTAYGIESIKLYLETMLNYKFKSETDTEVISVLYNKLKKKFKDDKKLIFDTLGEMFLSGWGVLLEIDPDTNIVTCIKDSTRDLWMYKQHKSITIISEPTPFITEYTSCCKLKEGIYPLNDEVECDDYTENTNKALNWWNSQDDKDIDMKKCDICGIQKYTISTKKCKGHRKEDYYQDRCFNCLLLDTKKQVTTDEHSKMENKKKIYETYLGDNK